MACAFGKRRNRHVRQSLSDLSPANEEAALRRRRPTHVRPVSTLPLLFRSSPSFPLSFSSDLTEASEPKVIMQYQDDFVGSFRSYFSRFCRRRLLARQQSPLFMRAACPAYGTACRLTCEVRSHAPRSHGQRGRG